MSAATKDLVYLCRALKAPSLLAAADRLLEQAARDGWSHTELLAACLEREVAARQAHGAGMSRSVLNFERGGSVVERFYYAT